MKVLEVLSGIPWDTIEHWSYESKQINPQAMSQIRCSGYS